MSFGFVRATDPSTHPADNTFVRATNTGNNPNGLDIKINGIPLSSLSGEVGYTLSGTCRVTYPVVIIADGVRFFEEYLAAIEYTNALVWLSIWNNRTDSWIYMLSKAHLPEIGSIQGVAYLNYVLSFSLMGVNTTLPGWVPGQQV